MTGLLDSLLGGLLGGLGTSGLTGIGSIVSMLAAPIIGGVMLGGLLLVGGFLQFGLGVNVFGLLREFVIGGGGLTGF